MKIVILQPLAVDKKQLDIFVKSLSDKGHEITTYNAIPKDKADAIGRAKTQKY